MERRSFYDYLGDSERPVCNIQFPSVPVEQLVSELPEDVDIGLVQVRLDGKSINHSVDYVSNYLIVPELGFIVYRNKVDLLPARLITSRRFVNEELIGRETMAYAFIDPESGSFTITTYPFNIDLNRKEVCRGNLPTNRHYLNKENQASFSQYFNLYHSSSQLDVKFDFSVHTPDEICDKLRT